MDRREDKQFLNTFFDKSKKENIQKHYEKEKT